MAMDQFCLNGVLCEYTDDNAFIKSYDEKEGEWTMFEYCKYEKLKVKFECQTQYSLRQMKSMIE
jgi:hypothetical protein